MVPSNPSESREFNYPATVVGSAIGTFIGDTVMGAVTNHDIIGWATKTGPEFYHLAYVAPRDVVFGALSGLIQYGIHRSRNHS